MLPYIRNTIVQKKKNKARGKPFNPNLIPDLIAWYDFADTSTITTDANGINAVNDKSTQNNDLIQNVNASKPQYVIGQNGRMVADFDGINDTLFNSAALNGFLNEQDSHSVYLVYKNDVGGNLFVFEFRPLGNNGIAFAGNSGNRDFYHGTCLTAYLNTTFQLVNANYVIDLANYDSVNGRTFYRGNILGVSNIELSLTNIAYANMFLGSLSGLGLFFDGKIGEMLIYQRSLSVSERTNIFNYLSSKWAI